VSLSWRVHFRRCGIRREGAFPRDAIERRREIDPAIDADAIRPQRVDGDEHEVTRCRGRRQGREQDSVAESTARSTKVGVSFASKLVSAHIDEAVLQIFATIFVGYD
jgi:hypothetical protein